MGKTVGEDIPDGEQEPHWVVDAKFEPNRPNVDLVVRERLIKALDAALERKLALVVAPAGFGKSTLLGQWCAALKARSIAHAWLTLDENDSHANQFIAYVALSLVQAGVHIGELEIGARNGFSDSPTRSVLNSLIKYISYHAAPCVLVLDDYHLIEAGPVDDIVKQLLREAPKSFSIVINSRAAPAVDAPILIASGDAIEIGAEQLRFTKEETISALGAAISATDADDIYTQTEGWPVAVQLARVQKQARPAAKLKPGASGGLVASYLTEQVLSSIDEDIRGFLLTVSGLERFSPELANAVRNQDDSRGLIRRLAPLTALLVPLDEEGDWYRLHHLFAEYLVDTLRTEDPGRLTEIYHAASHWFAGNGAVIEAVRYAALAGDHEMCERLVLEAGGWKVILTEGIGVLRRLFRALPKEIVNDSPRLLIARAYLHCKDGEQQLARNLLDSAAALQSDPSEPFYERDFHVVESMINVYEDTPAWAQSLSEISIRNKKLVNYGPLEMGTLKCEETLLQLTIGDFDAASGSLKAAFGSMRQSGSVLGLNYCYLHAGALALHRGELDAAEANIARALEMAVSNFGSDSGLKHMAATLNYALRVWRGEASAEELDDFSQTLRHIDEYDGWTDIYLIGLDAAFHLAQQCGDNQFSEGVADQFLKSAANRQLDRLESFARTLKYKALRLGKNRQDALALRAQIADWMTAREPSRQPRAWQSYFLSASALAEDGGGLDEAGFANLAEAIAFSHSMKAQLHQVRLGIAKAVALRDAGLAQQSNNELVGAVKTASRHRIIGPFLCNRKLVRALREARDEIRTNEDELIASNIIADILARADVLHPGREGQLLSVREQEILEQLADGKMNKEIARQLELTENTVKFHLKNIFSKLSVNRRTQAIAEARRLKLIE